MLWAIPFSGERLSRSDPLLEPARPDWSPKGDTATFQAYSGGTFHIWILKPDGSSVDLPLVTGMTGSRGSHPRYCIAFASDRALKGSYDIWVVDVASGELAVDLEFRRRIRAGVVS